jgi:hypothetical protein
MIVLVECYHDLALVRSLGVQRRHLLHEGSKGNVMNRLREVTLEAAGLIDADPNAGCRPAELSNYHEEEAAQGLRLLVHAREPQKKVVEINPRLEEWLVAHADACGVSLARYSLPQTARAMHRIARCDRMPGFQPFLEALLRADEGMRKLKAWLSQ